MAIHLNLVGRKKRESKGRSVASFGFIIVLSVFSIYFLFVSGMTIYKLVTLKNKLAKINQESIQLSEQIRSRNDLVTKYVLVKYILDYFANIEKSKFHYKEYLDQVVAILPRNSVLKNMDFGVKGWISISASLPDHTSLLEFEEVTIKGGLFTNTPFETVYVESVSRDKDGKYLIKMHFAIAKNG